MDGAEAGMGGNGLIEGKSTGTRPISAMTSQLR